MTAQHYKNEPGDKQKYALYLTVERAEFLKKIAKAQNRSLSGQVDWIIAGYIAEVIAETQQDG